LAGKGPLTDPGVGAMGFFNSQNETSSSPDAQIMTWSLGHTADFGLKSSTVAGIRGDFYESHYGRFEDSESFLLMAVLLRPASTGRVSLASADPFRPPKIESNSVWEEDDRRILKEGSSTFG